jgi:hypothetical protein
MGFGSTSMAAVFNQVGGGVRNNTQLENQWLSNAPPEMQAQMRAQLEMQKQQELTQLITQMMKQMHEMSMSVIRNVGG